MENKSFEQNRVGINHEGNQGQPRPNLKGQSVKQKKRKEEGIKCFNSI
jgi:hypothetical protein